MQNDHPTPNDHPAPRSGISMAMLFTVGVAAVCLSFTIIALAGLAGYNDGVRTAAENADITRQADINRQYELALTDVAGGNLPLAVLRLEHVVLTLGADSAEAAALLTQVNAVTPTPTATAIPPTPTASPTIAATPTAEPDSDGGLDLDPASLLETARAAYVVRDWDQTIELLDILRGIDATYAQAEVEDMLQEALVAQATAYLRDPTGERLAQGILLADRAQTLGSIGDLAYEAYIAGRYLDALAADGMECLLAVREWESVYNEAPQYRDVPQRLANSYAACGDAYTYQTEYCPAEQYYTWSLDIAYDSDVAARRDEARDICAQATPTPTPTPEALPTTEGETPPPA